ncbi:MAG: MASE1 domain-containing protein [Candidatus Sungbacteria bacterium]|nr:MASE1 domain-containing protein [Candidatus Sungbacteria bacterium]
MNKNNRISRIPRDLPLLAVLFAVYFISAKLGLQLAFVHASATAVWPPTGIALFAFLMFGYRVWPAIFLGAFVANITTAGSFATTLGIATGNMLEGLTGAYLVNRYANGRYAFEQASDIFKFAFFGGVLATMVSATIGVSSLALGGFARWSDFGAIWWTWWLGDLSGALVVAPFLIVWFTPHSWYGWKKAVEGSLLCIVLVVVGYVIYSGLFPYQYILLPVLLWAAFRFNARGATAATLILSSIALWETLHGRGPFTLYGEAENQSLLLLQTFMAVVSMAVVPVAALISAHRRLEGRFRALIEHSTDVISLIDGYGNILYTSPSTKAVLGYQPEEFVRTNEFAYIHEEDQERMRQTLADLREQPGKTITIDVRVRRSDGSWIWIESTKTNLLLEPSVRAIVLNYRDVTERKEIDRAKSEFISLASHQLRTPLSIISWASELLFRKEGKRISDSARQNLQDIMDANRRMINLVDALLNISRIELGTFFVEPTEVFPGTVAAHVLDELMPAIAEKKIVVTKEFNMDTTMRADENLLYIILQNLLTNAVKYTPEYGTITVKIEKKATGTILSVADTGYGIPDEAKPHLFTKFFRAENVRTKNEQSVGLGLYMTKAIVDQVGGRLWYESHLNKGTVFFVEIPPTGMRASKNQKTVRVDRSLSEAGDASH